MPLGVSVKVRRVSKRQTQFEIIVYLQSQTTKYRLDVVQTGGGGNIEHLLKSY